MSLVKRLYLIRHGETNWNASRRFQGKTDTELSEAGITQSRLLADRLTNAGIDVIYCSPLKRALQTAEPIKITTGANIIEAEELKEIDFAHWEGLTIVQIKEQYKEEFEKCRKDPFTHGFREGLAFNAVKETVETFVNKYLSVDASGNIAVVSHSIILKMLLITMLDLTPDSFHSFHLRNCSVTLLEIKDNNTTMLKLGDDTHLLF